jgi:hypothetical protein
VQSATNRNQDLSTRLIGIVPKVPEGVFRDKVAERVRTFGTGGVWRVVRTVEANATSTEGVAA